LRHLALVLSATLCGEFCEKRGPQAHGAPSAGEVVATFRQPFDLLAETTAIARRGEEHGQSAKSEIWLRDLPPRYMVKYLI
jgi:hypothetical protein